MTTRCPRSVEHLGEREQHAGLVVDEQDACCAASTIAARAAVRATAVAAVGSVIVASCRARLARVRERAAVLRDHALREHDAEAGAVRRAW